jgi:anti-anti-sigma factor
MGLDITARRQEDVVILDLEGRITVGESGSLREAVEAQKAAGNTRLILNLEKVSFIDSTGLGAMVICHTTITKAGGALKLLHLNKRNIELLVLTKLHTIFDVYSDERDAINSFFPDRKVQRFDILNFVRAHQSDQPDEL